jgi:hypothetical protein
MKMKMATLVLAVVCSTVLVASAQTPLEPRPKMAGRDPFAVGYRARLPQYAPQDYQVGALLSSIGSQSHEEAQLANQTAELAQQLASAKSDTDRDKLKTELSKILEKQFALRQERHQKEIESLEAQVKKLRDLVDKRQENRREIIANRLDQILRESQGLGW